MFELREQNERSDLDVKFYFKLLFSRTLFSQKKHSTSKNKLIDAN